MNFIIPARCYICDDQVLDNFTICHSCWKEFSFIDNFNVCCFCGYPLDNKILPDNGHIERKCLACSNIKPIFEKLRSVCSYNSFANKIIARLKYGDATYMARFVAILLVNLYRLHFSEVDWICAVPMHKKSMQMRLYNQAILICRIFANNLKMKKCFAPDLLIKSRMTKCQVGLNKMRRTSNLSRSMIVNQKYARSLDNAKILIIDDVATTGSTLHESARAIKDIAPNAKIFCITFARTLL